MSKKLDHSDIESLEIRARNTLLTAREEAKQIIEKAKIGLRRVEDSKAHYDSLRLGAIKTGLDIESGKREIDSLKKRLDNELAECEILKASLRNKVLQLREILDTFSKSIK